MRSGHWPASTGFGPVCFIKSNFNAVGCHKIFMNFIIFLCWLALWRTDFYFPEGLCTGPHCQRYQWCFCDSLVSIMVWSENYREYMEYRQDEGKRHWCMPPEGCYHSNQLQQNHKMNASMPRHNDAEIHEKKEIQPIT